MNDGLNDSKQVSKVRQETQRKQSELQETDPEPHVRQFLFIRLESVVTKIVWIPSFGWSTAISITN